MEITALKHRGLLLTLLVVVIASTSLCAQTVGNLPKDKAGTIGPLEGRLAFLRESNVWAMDVDGQNQEMICEVGNADGKLDWSPDNRSIVFTRKGYVDVKGPDYMGGHHKLYDLFIASLDSAYHNNRLWWIRLTSDMGSRDPEWSRDGSRIVFYKDLHANDVNADVPNYQVCTIAPDGNDLTVLRKDWANAGNEFMMNPSMNAAGDLAFVYFKETKPLGLATVPAGKYTLPMDSIESMATDNLNLVAPAWSPDGKWLAYVSNNMADAGLYIATPDLKERYLVAAPPVGTYLYTYPPSFSPDSKWLTFSTTDGSIWICDITGSDKRRITGPGLDKAPAWSKAGQ